MILHYSSGNVFVNDDSSEELSASKGCGMDRFCRQRYKPDTIAYISEGSTS